MSIGRDGESLLREGRAFTRERASATSTKSSIRGRTTPCWTTSRGGTDDRVYAITQLIRNGVDLALIYNNTKIDMFFLEVPKNIIEFESVVRANPTGLSETLRAAKRAD